MLKVFQHLADEIRMAQHNVALYPDPEGSLSGAGKREWYEGQLESALDAVTEATDKLQEAYDKDREALAEEGWTEEGHAKALAARDAEANKTEATAAEEGASSKRSEPPKEKATAAPASTSSGGGKKS